MPAKTTNSTDQFANQAIISMVESAANTLTFKKLESGISISDKVAWVINRVEYFSSDFQDTNFNGKDDLALFGLSVSNSWSAATLTETTIIDFNAVYRRDFGTAATGLFQTMPIVKDFSQLPGGGILVPPVPLYGWVSSSGVVNAITVVARLWYTLLTLTVDQYWELVEARRIISA